MDAPEQAPESPPPQIDGYRIIGRAGAGGQGTTWIAETLKPSAPGAKVAIKVLRYSARGFPRQYWTELEALANLRLPCLPRVVDSGIAGGHPWIATEYIDGIDLVEFERGRSREAIVDRLLLPMLLEATRALEDRIDAAQVRLDQPDFVGREGLVPRSGEAGAIGATSRGLRGSDARGHDLDDQPTKAHRGAAVGFAPGTEARNFDHLVARTAHAACEGTKQPGLDEDVQVVMQPRGGTAERGGQVARGRAGLGRNRLENLEAQRRADGAPDRIRCQPHLDAATHARAARVFRPRFRTIANEIFCPWNPIAHVSPERPA